MNLADATATTVATISAVCTLLLPFLVRVSAGQSVVPGTGFEPVCLSAARFKFDLTPSLTVRGRSWESQPPWAAPLRLLVNRGELQPLLQPRPLVANSGQVGQRRSSERGSRSSRWRPGPWWPVRLL